MCSVKEQNDLQELKIEKKKKRIQHLLKLLKGNPGFRKSEDTDEQLIQGDKDYQYWTENYLECAELKVFFNFLHVYGGPNVT